MKTVVSISRDDERLEAASRWALKIDEGMLNLDDRAALNVWLDEDPEHHNVLLEVAAVWDKAEVLTRLADMFPLEIKRQQEPPVPRHWVWMMGSTVAASLGVLAITAIFLVLHLDNVSTVITQTAAYETAIGEHKTVLLPDGSEVVLNTDSQISLTFTSAARVLYLERGEIFVRVAKEDRPLSVIAADQIVQAVGTEFTVEITEDQYVQVMVTEGRVVVGIQPKPAELPGDTDEVANTFVLPPVLAQLKSNTFSAGEEVILGDPDFVRKAVTADEIEVKLSWQEGRLIFRSEPLEKALREVERYTTVEFVVLDEALKSKVLSGRFRAGDVDTLLTLLRTNFNIRCEFDGEDRVLLSAL